MSALGNYIHLNYKRYKMLGVSRYGEKEYNLAIDNYRTAMVNRIKKISPDIDLDTLEKFAAQLQKNSLTVIQKDTEKMDQQLLKKLEILYHLLVSRLKPDKTGRNFENQPISKFLKQHIKSSSILSELKGIRTQSQTCLNYIEKTISEIKKKNYNTNSQTLKELIKAYDTYAKLAYLPTLKKSKNPQFNEIYTESVVKRIDEAMENALFDNAQTAIIGAFGELTIAFCEKTAENLATSEVNKFFRQHVKGEERSQIQLPKNLIVESFVPTWMQESDDGNKYIIAMPTQNKIDVEIKIGEKEIGASAKTTTLKGHKHYYNDNNQLIIRDPYIRHLQDVNLFYTLAFLNSEEGFEDIGNHWLNMHAAHADVEEDVEKENKNKYIIDGIIQKEVAIQALSTGNPLKQADSANVFVYINLTTGKISIISIKDILNTMKIRGGFTEDDLTNKGFKNGVLKKHGQIIQDPNISTIKINNIKIDNKTDPNAAAEQRINNILNALHRQKIKVSYQIPL